MGDRTGASRAEAEAAGWFETLRQTSVSTGALREFHAWKKIPENAAAFGRVEAGWKATGAIASHPAVRAELSALLERRAAQRGPDWRLVAAPVAVAGVLALVWLGVGAAWPQYATEVGEQRTVALRDGSRVVLNTDSRIRVWTWGSERRVWLHEGQAMFEAAPDAARPFVVVAGPAEIRALGTKFDVRRSTEAVAVVLLEGKVAVSGADDGAAVLAPGQQLSVTAQGVSPVRPAAEDAAAWTTGRLVFRGAPLREAVAEANRYSRRRIALDVPAAMADEPVSGTFEAGDIEALAAALTHYYDLEATRPSPQVIRLAPRG
jgi:transmembrane sensor